MVLSSFDQENHDRILKEAYLEQGLERGIEKGKSTLLENLIQKKLATRIIIKSCSKSSFCGSSHRTYSINSGITQIVPLAGGLLTVKYF